MRPREWSRPDACRPPLTAREARFLALLKFGLQVSRRALKKIGNEFVITAEEAKSLWTELDGLEGMQFDCSYISPYFVTNADKMRAEMPTS